MISDYFNLYTSIYLNLLTFNPNTNHMSLEILFFFFFFHSMNEKWKEVSREYFYRLEKKKRKRRRVISRNCFCRLAVQIERITMMVLEIFGGYSKLFNSHGPITLP